MEHAHQQHALKVGVIKEKLKLFASDRREVIPLKQCPQTFKHNLGFCLFSLLQPAVMLVISSVRIRWSVQEKVERQ